MALPFGNKTLCELTVGESIAYSLDFDARNDPTCREMGLGADFINTPAIVARSLTMNLAYRTLLLTLSVSLLTQKQPHLHSHSFTSFLRSFAQLKFTKSPGTVGGKRETKENHPEILLLTPRRWSESSSPSASLASAHYNSSSTRSIRAAASPLATRGGQT